ncbi:related to alcohol dehydrogenase [Phialocephala subalpina]|uniref:Related to alcohol dehydrogenase n=1 Tax=Phialocephala subalpina TaxID=576137 RepID=A0A1L7XVK1_9HELO|nr:related to alcohol dehydrogenase [Phialocephala subalpina]
MAISNGTSIPKVQKAATVGELGGPVELVDDYPVPQPGHDEVLAKVLYSGVCQSDLDTKSGTAMKPDGTPITALKFPHVGGHEGVGRIIALGPGCDPSINLGSLVGIRFASRICRRCEYCLAGNEQHCVKSTNHLHHEDGSFQEYITLDADYLMVLPGDVDPSLMGPVLCGGLTVYKACLNANLKPGDWLVVFGAGGGLGHLAVQYGKAFGARIIGVDGGAEKREFVLSLGVRKFVDFTTSPNVVQDIQRITNGGAQAAIVAVGNPTAFTQGAEALRIGGTLCCCGAWTGTSTE